MSLNCLDSIDRPVPIKLSPLSLNAEPSHWWCFSIARNEMFSSVCRGIKGGHNWKKRRFLPFLCPCLVKCLWYVILQSVCFPSTITGTLQWVPSSAEWVFPVSLSIEAFPEIYSSCSLPRFTFMFQLLSQITFTSTPSLPFFNKAILNAWWYNKECSLNNTLGIGASLGFDNVLIRTFYYSGWNFQYYVKVR